MSTDRMNNSIVIVDNEISFNMGSAIKLQSSVNDKRMKSKVVPDFNKMHAAQFNSQKSITAKVKQVIISFSNMNNLYTL